MSALAASAVVSIPAATASATGGNAGVARAVVVSSTSTTATSRNWSGYYTYAPSHGTDFNFVKATWVQPVVKCQAADAWTVFWVGLDGWYDGTVEQGGSSARCVSKGAAPQYTLWWEMFPTVPVTSVMTTKPGDTITASVTYNPGTKRYIIVVKDVTTGKGFTKSEVCQASCGRSSAEVITEDVGHFGANSYFPLANYGTVKYTGISVRDIAGHTGTLGGPNWQNGRITEAQSGITYGTTSALQNNGASFSNTWKHS